jgi:hypothetical protein
MADMPLGYKITSSGWIIPFSEESSPDILSRIVVAAHLASPSGNRLSRQVLGTEFCRQGACSNQ